jgi:hypothetical protein
MLLITRRSWAQGHGQNCRNTPKKHNNQVSGNLSDLIFMIRPSLYTLNKNKKRTTRKSSFSMQTWWNYFLPRRHIVVRLSLSPLRFLNCGKYSKRLRRLLLKIRQDKWLKLKIKSNQIYNKGPMKLLSFLQTFLSFVFNAKIFID